MSKHITGLQRQVPGILPHEMPDTYSWDLMVYDCIHNIKIAERTERLPFVDLNIRRRNCLLGEVARLWKDTPAHQVLHYQIDICPVHLPDCTWRRPPGRDVNKARGVKAKATS